MQTERLDVFLHKVKGIQSREKAKTLILSGFVRVNNKIILKPSYIISENDEILIDNFFKYVGRGGYKLEKALDVFEIFVDDKIAVDVGASTGGFTDCLLQNGAKKVYAVDVGHSQLDKKLLEDNRVFNLEKTHIKDLNFANLNNNDIDIFTIDVSFISLKKVLPFILTMSSSKTDIIALLKPQYEIGHIKKGIVRDIKLHKPIIHDMFEFISVIGAEVLGFDYSPIKGSDGNIEFLLHIKKANTNKNNNIDYINIINKAHKEL